MNRSLAASGSVNLSYCSDALEALQFFNIAEAMKSIISGARNTRGRAQLLRLCLFATLWTAACEASLSLGFSRQGYWSGLPCPSPGDLPHSGIEHTSPVLAGGFFTTEPPEKPHISDFFFKTQIGMLVHTHTHTNTHTQMKAIISELKPSDEKIKTPLSCFCILFFSPLTWPNSVLDFLIPLFLQLCICVSFNRCKLPLPTLYAL